MLNVEINLQRGEIPVLGWDDTFRDRVLAHMEAVPEDGNPSDRDGFYRRLIDSQRNLIGCVEKVLGDDAVEPFTITINVNGKNRVYPPGPRDY